MQGSRVSPSVVVGLVGIVLLVTGTVLYATAGWSTSGWFAYTPDSELVEMAPPGLHSLLPERVWGLATAGLGALLLAGVAGYRIGRASGTSQGEAS